MSAGIYVLCDWSTNPYFRNGPSVVSVHILELIDSSNPHPAGSTGASCTFSMDEAFNASTILGYASDCVTELLMWLLASIRIYRLGKAS